MNEADAEEVHYRKSVGYIADRFIAKEITETEAITSCLAMFPSDYRDVNGNWQTCFRMDFQDLAEAPAIRALVVNSVVDVILDKQQHALHSHAFDRAVAVLALRSLVVTIAGIDFYHINGAGRFSADDVIDEAARR